LIAFCGQATSSRRLGAVDVGSLAPATALTLRHGLAPKSSRARRAGQSSTRSLGKLGAPPVSPGVTTGKGIPVNRGPEQRSTPPRSHECENSPGTEVSRTERQSDGAETNRVSLSRGIVPFQTGETISREPGSRAGRRQVVEASSARRMGPLPQESVSIGTDAFRSEIRLLVGDCNQARQDWLLESAPATKGRLQPGLVSRNQEFLPLIFRRLKKFHG
jgi:hypothetical protein